MNKLNNTLKHTDEYHNNLVDNVGKTTSTQDTGEVANDDIVTKMITKKAQLLLGKIKYSNSFSYLDKKNLSKYNKIIDEVAERNTFSTSELTNNKDKCTFEINKNLQEINYLDNLSALLSVTDNKIKNEENKLNDLKSNLANKNKVKKADELSFYNMLESLKNENLSNLKPKVDIPKEIIKIILSLKPDKNFNQSYNDLNCLLDKLVAQNNEISQDIIMAKNNLNSLNKTSKKILLSGTEIEKLVISIKEIEDAIAKDKEQLMKTKSEIITAPLKKLEAQKKIKELTQKIEIINSEILKMNNIGEEILSAKQILVNIDKIDSYSSNIVSKAMNNAFPKISSENKNDKSPEISKENDQTTFGNNIYPNLIKENDDNFLNRWYSYLQDLLMKPQREFIIDKNNITNFKIVFKNPQTGLSTEKETIVQLNHSISSHSTPVFAIGSSTFQATSRGVKLMAGTLVTNAFENVPLPHLHSISYSANADISQLPLLDMYIIPIEDLNDGRFEGLIIKGIKFLDMRQTDGASSGGRYYAFNFVAKDFIPVDFSTLSQFYI